MNEYPSLRPGYIQRLFQLLLVTLFGLILAGLAMGLILRGGVTTRLLRVATVVQDLLVFIVPAIFTAVLVTDRPDRLLETDRRIGLTPVILAVLAMIVSIPAMNTLVAWNESLSMPSSLQGVEAWMREAEENAGSSINILLGGDSAGDLIVSLMIVALLAGFSEELFFRGALQRLFASERLNPHVAIWLTAFIFSTFHMQFFGFFPRLALGAFFGYLLYWSGSIWLPVAIHVFNNAIVVITSWYAKANPGSGITGVDSIGTDSMSLVAGSVAATALALIVLSGRLRGRVGETE